MPLIDLYASRYHYLDHLLPIWRQLERSGHAGTRYGLGGELLRNRRHGGMVLVAGFSDHRYVAPAPTVYVEHGAGQSYDGDAAADGNGCYSGGRGLDGVRLFICPNDVVAARWQAVYDAPTVAVGCPKLDAWHDWHVRPHLHAADAIAVTFHWSCPLVPETRTAWPHYNAALPQLVEWARVHDVELLGHGHPRIWRQLEQRWRTLGVEPVDDLADVFDRASLLVGDNTSALPEFASLGRPVLWLNAPWFRRDVHHGGRFWTWPQGQVSIDDPAELCAGVEAALEDRPLVRASREAMVRSIYAATDGQAAHRAAAAITEVLDA